MPWEPNKSRVSVLEIIKSMERANMWREGVHYHVLHVARNCKHGGQCRDKSHFKPALSKAGSQIIANHAGLQARYPGIEKYQTALADGKVLAQIIIICELYHENELVASGAGAYDFSKEPGGFNTGLKQAEKRAFVNAIQQAFALADMFTQDMEEHQTEPGQVNQEVWRKILELVGEENSHDFLNFVADKAAKSGAPRLDMVPGGQLARVLKFVETCAGKFRPVSV